MTDMTSLMTRARLCSENDDIHRLKQQIPLERDVEDERIRPWRLTLLMRTDRLSDDPESLEQLLPLTTIRNELGFIIHRAPAQAGILSRLKPHYEAKVSKLDSVAEAKLLWRKVAALQYETGQSQLTTIIKICKAWYRLAASRDELHTLYREAHQFGIIDEILRLY